MLRRGSGMRKHIYKVLLLSLILLVACNTSENEREFSAPESNIEEGKQREDDNNINVGVEEDKVEQEKPQISYEYSNQYMERKYYSPNGSNYVTEKIDGVTDPVGSYVNRLYLGSSLNEIGVLYQPHIKKSLSMNPIVWIDDTSFIVGGRYIYDIEKKSIREYLLKDVLDSSYLMNYALNCKGTKVAYSLIDLNDNKGKVFIYDIETREVIKIHEYEKVFTSLVNLNIAWDINENIYFDVSNTGEEYQVFKYERSSEDSYSLYEDAAILNISNEGRFISIADIATRNTLIVDTLQDKKYVTSYTVDIVWIDETTFAYLPLNSNTTLVISELDEGKLKTIESIDLLSIKVDDYEVENLRYEDEKLLLDIVKFVDNQTHNNVIDSKTYYIDVGRSG